MRQRQGGISADLGPQPKVGELGDGRALGVDHDDARAALLRGLQLGPLHRIGDGEIAADDERAARVLDVAAASMSRPVTRALTARQPPHRSWLIIQLGEPIERIIRAVITLRLK